MSFLLAQADFLTTNDLQAGISEETVEEDNLLRMLPFEDIAGFQQVEWNRENSLGSLASTRRSRSPRPPTATRPKPSPS